MKIGEFRDLGADELKQREKDLDDQLFRLRIQKSMGQQEAGYKVKSGDLTMIPTTVVELSKESQAKTVLHLMEVLEDHDDVEAVYANFDIPDSVLEAVSA